MRIEIQLKGNLAETIRKAGPRIGDAVRKVTKQHADRVYKNIKFSTPTDSGKARAGWKKKLSDRGRAARTVAITNDVEYINVLEHGSYPVRAARNVTDPRGAIRRGAAYLGGHFPPGPRTVRAPGGQPKMLAPGNVSRQAPHGMVRKALGDMQEAYVFDLERAIEEALAGDDVRISTETIDPGRSWGDEFLRGL